MQEGPSASDDAGGEAELADEGFEVLGAAGAAAEEAPHGPQQVEAAVVVDRDRAGDGVDDQAEVAQALRRPCLLVGVAAQAQPGEHGHGGRHVRGALLWRGGAEYQVVDVHRAVDAKRGKDLDELARQAAGEGWGHS